MRPAILKICQEIDKLESDADKVMRSAISELFRNETDTRQLIKLKAVYESLESATDKCQDVANVIESVVLENSCSGASHGSRSGLPDAGVCWCCWHWRSIS